jgi:poly(ADP-ribose) glycohydrolase ARH3
MPKNITRTDSHDRGRFSARRKTEAVVRLLRGEDLDALSRELGVTAATLSSWRQAFLDGGAAAMKSRPGPFDRGAFFADLVSACESAEYREKLDAAARVEAAEQLAGLGNRIEALHSVPTAIASFALTPESFEQTVGNLILMGGDTDTLAAMAGALSGARLGVGRLPSRLVNLLESGPKGRAYLIGLSQQLLEAYERTSVERAQGPP